MAKKHLPWEEIVLWSLLGGVLATGLSWVGLTVYRWAWDEQALLEATGGQGKVYGLVLFGIGALMTAIVLAFGAHRETRPAEPNRNRGRRR